ncbi:phasin family protein [Methylibium rhizosphaerae]|uniref:phasin family protein n=1 Tax=Methylibium rhizosphaerae TaxID=2570323 RepID=UPI001128CE4C|nr:phasin family protein [Methylibium rhizosphaerae]
MATRSRRSSGSSTTSSSEKASRSSPAPETAPAETLVGQAVNAPTTALHNAWAAWLQLGKVELTAQVEAAQALLRTAEAVRQAQLEANQKAQAAHAQVAEQIDSVGNLNDVVGLQLTLLREDLQGALAHWTHLAEVTSAAVLDGFTRGTESASRLQSSFWGSALQWTQLAQTDAPGAAEEIEASVDHVVNPLIASPLLWPSQEAAREAMTLANSAWKDWFSWSGLGGDTQGSPRSVH